MNIVYERCAGLDVPKRSVTACASTPDARGQRHKERESFSTMPPDVLRLRQWLTSRGVTPVALESTSVSWQPIYQLREGHFELLLVNAQHLKAVPGRKTDTKDAEWLADLLQHGLLRPSFVPPASQRQVRDLTRSRTSLIEERSRAVNRLRPFEAQLTRLETIPGIKRRLAEVLLAEIGADMGRFPSARHLASGAGLCPGNHERAGKRLSGRTRKGSPWLRTALVEAAHAATHAKECYLSAQ
jgi:transposase